jgi:hypothetical protein
VLHGALLAVLCGAAAVGLRARRADLCRDCSRLNLRLRGMPAQSR